MRLEFSPAADADLVEIASFIARDNVPRAVLSSTNSKQPAPGSSIFLMRVPRVPTLAQTCDPCRMEAM